MISKLELELQKVPVGSDGSKEPEDPEAEEKSDKDCKIKEKD